MKMESIERGAWWRTVTADRRVLVLAPTVTSVKRLLDIAGLFHADLRVELSFTVPPNMLGRGTQAMLGALGVPLLPWRRAVEQRHDLAIATHLSGIAEVDAPLALFSHGASRNSLAKPRGRGCLPVPAQVHGFSRSALIQSGMLVPAALPVGHERELELLALDCPEALPVATVVGDPCLDRLTAARTLRERYRSALGLRPGQQLVVATSTWRGNSMFGDAPHVIGKLTELLDSSDFRVVLLMHPNIVAAHGEYQVRAWSADAIRRGLIIAPAEQDWQPFLTAADYVIGDHGSVTLYAAAVGVPVLLGAYPAADVHPRSGAAALGAIAPRLAASVPLRTQLEQAREQFDAEAMADVAALISSEPGAFARLTRRLLYGMLGLGQPATPARLAPAPAPPSLRALARSGGSGVWDTPVRGGEPRAVRPGARREAAR